MNDGRSDAEQQQVDFTVLQTDVNLPAFQFKTTSKTFLTLFREAAFLLSAIHHSPPNGVLSQSGFSHLLEIVLILLLQMSLC